MILLPVLWMSNFLGKQDELQAPLPFGNPYNNPNSVSVAMDVRLLILLTCESILLYAVLSTLFLDARNKSSITVETSWLLLRLMLILIRLRKACIEHHMKAVVCVVQSNTMLQTGSTRAQIMTSYSSATDLGKE